VTPGREQELGMDRAGVLDASNDVESELAAADRMPLHLLLSPDSPIPAVLAGSIRRVLDASAGAWDQVSAFNSSI
jgi:FXSXX-COOH protein